MIERSHSLPILGLVVSSLFLLVSCSPPRQSADGPHALSETQIRLLAEEILKNTPEHTHFSEGTVFSWVVLAPEVQTNPQALQDEVMRLLKEKYKVYLDKNRLPDDVLVKDENGQLIGYRHGFSFSYFMTPESKGHVKIHYSDYEGRLAASAHWKRYGWTGRNWETVEKSLMVVS